MTVITTEELREVAWEGIDVEGYAAARDAGFSHGEVVSLATELRFCDLSDHLGIAADLRAAGASLATIDAFVADTGLAWDPVEVYLELLGLAEEGWEVTGEEAYDAAVQYHEEELDADDYLAARRAGATHREAVAAAAVD